MFEKTRAAATKAQEHLAVAKILLEHGHHAQAYAHASLALEEMAVYGVRLLTESGIAGWSDPPFAGRLKESDLTRPGNHRDKLRLGLVLASTQTVLGQVAETVREAPIGDPKAIGQLASGMEAAIGGALSTKFADPALFRYLKEGQLLREAAFYSTPRKAGSPGRQVPQRLRPCWLSRPPTSMRFPRPGRHLRK